MNTSKQIIVMVALVFLSVVATGAYTMWDPERADEAKGVQLEKTVRYGAYLFSQNCRVCHGNLGEGGSAANRLKLAPPLNRADLQGKDSSGVVNTSNKAQQYKLIVNTIVCGRVGKAMPTWGQSQGGTLNDEQIRQLATLISEGTGWEQANEYAIEGVGSPFNHHGDDGGPDQIKLAGALDASSTTVSLNRVDIIGKGDRLQVTETRLADGQVDPDKNEIMVITGAPDATNKTVTVERGVGTTSPIAHTEGLLLLKVPVPAEPAAITQPACGQNLPPAVPTAGAEAPSATLTITAQGTAWDKAKLSAIAGVPLKITVDNKDNAIPHNIHFFNGADATGADIAKTAIEPGLVVQTLDFGPLEAGDYYYRCDVHPQMEGVLTASVAGAAGAGGSTPAVEATATDAGAPASTATP